MISASDGLVISAGGTTLSDYPDLPHYTQKPADGVYVLDARGWLYRYVHLKSIDPAVRPGQRVKDASEDRRSRQGRRQRRVDSDFAVVQVLDPKQPDNPPPTIHASSR